MCDFGMKSYKMEGQNKQFVRFQNEISDCETPYRTFETLKTDKDERKLSWSSRIFSGIGGLRSFGFGSSRVFSEDHQVSETEVYDPRSKLVQRWNNLFIIICLLSLFIDPFFFYLPLIDEQKVCARIQSSLKVLVTVLRTVVDVGYIFRILLQFRTAFIAPSSRVFGRGELVVDPGQIAKRYISKEFILDVMCILPVPQVFIWGIMPAIKGNIASKTMDTLRYIVLVQYVPRLLRLIPLISQKKSATGVLLETAWAGAAYNLVLYILGSHVIGACWYLLAVEAQGRCWRNFCKHSICSTRFFDCHELRDPGFDIGAVNATCSSDSQSFSFGIYKDALDNDIISTGLDFVSRYFYCLWWGLRNLSSLGQGLTTSTYLEEVLFAILIAILGLILFAFLIGNMQTYLQSTTVRLEEMRLKRRDSEQWMRHRQLPIPLRERVRRYDHYKWMATKGVDEELLVKGLPLDLRRDIKRHLCLELVRRVPMFNKMDDKLLEAICERLRPALYTEHTYIVREGDPVNEMLFIIRGHLESATTNGGRTGFFNAGHLGPGDFCGEEVLTWALDLKPSKHLPTSTRTVKALVEVEAFSLPAEDLKFVSGQFRRLHSKQLQHTFRYHSQQWRTWAALYVQAAWRRFLHRKRYEEARRRAEEVSLRQAEEESHGASTIGAALLASRFAKNAMRGVQRMRKDGPVRISKPDEPDFSMVDDEE